MGTKRYGLQDTQMDMESISPEATDDAQRGCAKEEQSLGYLPAYR